MLLQNMPARGGRTLGASLPVDEEGQHLGIPWNPAPPSPAHFSPQPALLHQTPAEDLDKFISEFLQPNSHFLTQVRRAVDTICSFLKENCFRNSTTKVLKVVKVRPESCR